jgi:hypothetical protein
MRLTDRFILQPVLALVVSIFILLMGLRAEQALPITVPMPAWWPVSSPRRWKTPSHRSTASII